MNRRRSKLSAFEESLRRDTQLAAVAVLSCAIVLLLIESFFK